MKNRICLYARVSTDTQTTGLESQAHAPRPYCKLNGIHEAELFTDENQSGAKSSRPALDRMLTAAFDSFAGSNMRQLNFLNGLS